MWDTYLSEGEFATLHVYVCAAFLLHWSRELLQKKDEEQLLLFLQHLPTNDWTEDSIEMLLSQAYLWKTLYNESPSHIKARCGNTEGADSEKKARGDSTP